MEEPSRWFRHISNKVYPLSLKSKATTVYNSRRKRSGKDCFDPKITLYKVYAQNAADNAEK